MSFHESVPLIYDRPIIDEGFRCVHVDSVKRRVISNWPLDLHLMVLINKRVHRLRQISAVITREINGRDKLT